MKRITAFCLAVSIVLLCTSCAPRETYEATVTELGVPLEDTYMGGGIERSVWDIEVHHDALYVGSGDFDRNCGPVYACNYDFSTKTWNVDTVLNDEQIERIHIINDTLYIPGCDPKSSWSLGNFYKYENGEWETNNVLPGGIHNFDLIQFDGKLFAGLGVQGENSPIVASTDEETWEQVPLYKNGEPRETYSATYIRVYDFFVLDNTLYAYFYLSCSEEKAREIYRYDGEKFVYYGNTISEMLTRSNHYCTITQKANFKGQQYITAGIRLYRTADMLTFEKIDLGENTEVNDIRIIGKELYALCSEPYEDEEGEVHFRNSVKKSKDGKNFTELFWFNYPVRALSFTHYKKTFYFGMGNGARNQNDFHDENGMVLAVPYK